MWYKVEDKLPEIKHVYLDLFKSDEVLVKLKKSRPCIAYCYKDEEDGNVRWRSTCPEGWDITRGVTEWTEIKHLA